jgi:hypothetical protein
MEKKIQKLLELARSMPITVDMELPLLKTANQQLKAIMKQSVRKQDQGIQTDKK